MIYYLAACAVIGLALALWLRYGRPPQQPPLGATVRLSSPDGAATCTLESLDEHEWVLALGEGQRAPWGPVQADVTASPGSWTYVGAALPADSGKVLFHQPRLWAKKDRREHDRRAAYAPCTVDGLPCLLLDLSSAGARIRTEGSFARGCRVLLQSDELGAEPVPAWVLEDSANGWIRVRFEDEQPV